MSDEDGSAIGECDYKVIMYDKIEVSLKQFNVGSNIALLTVLFLNDYRKSLT